MDFDPHIVAAIVWIGGVIAVVLLVFLPWEKM